MENKQNYFQYTVDIFNRFSLPQRLLIGGIALSAVILLIFLIFAFNEPSYAVLYSNLAPEDASKVIESLTTDKIPYKIENEGKTVRVPAEKVYETRLGMAGKGIPSSGVVGYEVFDKQTMGMSEFMQKLNFKRALEGELSKTIMQQAEIEGARVHVVIPQRTVFRDEQKPPTASVVLKLRGVKALSDDNVSAISHLVASSVEGLDPNNVTIIDAHGKLLSTKQDDSLTVFTNKQYQLKGSVEKYLTEKAQSMLDGVLGFGNAYVKVNVDLDFNSVTKQSETFDPDTQVEISQQTIRAENGGRSLEDSTGSLNENTTTNYEVSRTVENFIQGAGAIRRITVAAVINDGVKEVKNGENVERVPVPRSADDLKKLENIISRSIGIDDSRNDEISVVSIPFENYSVEPVAGEEELSPKNIIDEYGSLVLMVAAIIAAMFVLKSLLSKLKEEKILIGGNTQSTNEPQRQLASPLGPIELEGGLQLEEGERDIKPLLEVGDIKKEISDEAIRRKVRQEKISNYVSKNPTEAAKLITIWLKEDEM